MGVERAMEILHVTKEMRSLIVDKAPAEDFVMSEPMIRIGFHYTEGEQKSGMAIKYTTCMALIDTGADGVYVDPSLIAHYNCPVAEGNSSLTINGEKSSTAYKASLFIIEESHSMQMWVGALPFKPEAVRFRIVLGRRFLQFCELNWHGPSKTVRLKMLENPNAY